MGGGVDARGEEITVKIVATTYGMPSLYSLFRCDVVSGAQLPRPAPSRGAKLARLSLFFHAINDRLERPLSMALWRLAFIPSFTTVSSYPSPRETPRLSITATTCRRRGVGSMAAPLSPLPSRVLRLVLLSRLHVCLLLFAAPRTIRVTILAGSNRRMRTLI